MVVRYYSKQELVIYFANKSYIKKSSFRLICHERLDMKDGWFIFSVPKQKTGGRTKVLLETIPLHKVVDIFISSFEISFEEQVYMLDVLDVK